MKIIHAADLHLGFRQFDRLTADGLNVREQDVAGTLTRFVDAAIGLEPDAIVVAGDVFHAAKPTNHAIVHALAEFARLAQALPATRIVMVAGNHDIGNTAAIGCVLPMFRHLGIHVAHKQAVRFTFPAADLEVLAVPDAPGLARPALVRDVAAAMTYGVLVIHGEAMGVKQGHAGARASITDITPDEMQAPSWDYVALGHYHQHERIDANVSYSGSIDFTSTNPWQEIDTPKGFIERDLLSGDEIFHVLEPSRRFIDLAPIYADGSSAADVEASITAAVGSVPDGAVVRCTVLGVSRDVQRAIHVGKTLKQIRRRCLSFALRCEQPAAIMATSGAVRKRESLDDMMRRILMDATRTPLPAHIDRAQLMERAQTYLDEASYGTPTNEPNTESNAVDTTAGVAA